MKLWLKGSALAAVAFAATTALGADHRDGAAVKMAANAENDINDVYAWVSNDNSDLILIQTIGGLPGISDFGDQTQYVFHVGRTDAGVPGSLLVPPPAETVVLCTFENNTNIACYLGEPGEPAVDWAIGDASPDGGLDSANGMFRVHAGNHADPFFFYLQGFNAARGLVNLAVAGGFLTPANFHPSGCVMEAVMNTSIQTATGGAVTRYGSVTTISQALLGMLNGAVSPDLSCADPTACLAGGYAVDDFATNTSLAIVVEVDKTAIVGTGETFLVYASTHTR